jgi:hypothetical protein
MKNFFYIVLSTFLLSIFLVSCERKIYNNKNAIVIHENNHTFLKLTGKRKPMVHDPISIFKSNLIDDTLMLQIPTLEDGVVDGSNITVEEGYYKYQGTISIDKNVLKVDLQIINTDNKILKPESYNGTYNLIR